MAGPTAGTDEQIVRDGVAREDVGDEDAVALGSPPAGERGARCGKMSFLGRQSLSAAKRLSGDALVSEQAGVLQLEAKDVG
jgi:hypothetical protein